MFSSSRSNCLGGSSTYVTINTQVRDMLLVLIKRTRHSVRYFHQTRRQGRTMLSPDRARLESETHAVRHSIADECQPESSEATSRLYSGLFE